MNEYQRIVNYEYKRRLNKIKRLANLVTMENRSFVSPVDVRWLIEQLEIAKVELELNKK